MQTAFNNLSSLSGWGSQFAGRTEIQTTRYKIPNFWGQSGNPILINRTFVPEMIRHINERDDWTFGTMHELSHNFDSWRWTFDAEFFANFKMAYVIDRNNATVFAGYTGFYTGLAQLRQYYRTDANPAGDGLSHTKAMAQGVYHHDALTYTFLRFQQSIGWEPFRQTFQYFHNLPVLQVPSRNIDKLNLFLTKLSDFSGQNVFGMFTARELQIYEEHFGGRIGLQTATIYWDTQVSYITNPDPWRNLETGRLLSFFISLIRPLPAPERDGYVFMGWYTAPQPSANMAETFGTNQYIDSFSAPTGNRIDGNFRIVGTTTAFAHWRPFRITNPGTNGQTVTVPAEGLNVTWYSFLDVPQYSIRVQVLPELYEVFQRENITTTNFTIPRQHFTSGRSHLITLTAREGTRVTHTTRLFTMQAASQQGINVTVVDGAGRPIQGALVQFVLCINNGGGSTSFHTNASGIATFPNAPTGNWGINVTHRDFASTPETSRSMSRNNVNLIQNEAFVMSERASTFRNLGWANVLDIVPAHRISSVYGYRSWTGNSLQWHHGIDINRGPGTPTGDRVNSPFAGSVHWIHPNSSGAAGGHGITIRHHDIITDTIIDVRHFHLHGAAHRENGTSLAQNQTVSAGEHVGLMGGSAWGSATGVGVHLHMDVTVISGPGMVPGAKDPRAFFNYEFVAHWDGLNIQH